MAFQSTRPHGARQGAWYRIQGSLLFQSTRPHGARPERAGAALGGGGVSIHAPARGATTARSMVPPAGRLFQSTRPHGARLSIYAETSL